MEVLCMDDMKLSTLFYSAVSVFSQRGTSFIEAIIVVTIIALIGVTSTPFLSQYIMNSDLKTAARDIAGDFFEMKHLVMSTGNVYRIDFNTEENSYTASSCDHLGHNCEPIQ
jgi:Tfp pilus assembly protein PilE